MDLIHKGVLTTTDDEAESDLDIQPKKQHKRPKPKSSEDSDSETEVQNKPSKPKRARRQCKPSSHVKLNSYVKTIYQNKPLVIAALSIYPNEIVTFASQNLQNHRDLAALEWSEYVFIQLCTLNKQINIESSWIEIKLFVETYQWALEVVYNIQKYIGSNNTLSSILNRNREYKITNHNIPEHVVFITKPQINYQVLKTYKLPHNALTRPFVANQVPARFKKIIKNNN